jgi:hypothetical protein
MRTRSFCVLCLNLVLIAANSGSASEPAAGPVNPDVR